MTVKNDMVEHNSYTSSVVYLWDLETFPTAGLIKVYKSQVEIISICWTTLPEYSLCCCSACIIVRPGECYVL